MFDLETAVKAALENAVKEDKVPLRFERFSDIDLKTWQGEKQVAFAKEQITGLTSQGDTSQLAFEIDRMAEGFALQGDYAQAYDLAQNEEKRAEYKAVLDAFNNVECSCEEIVGKGKTTVSTRFLKDRFYHHGQIAELWQCATCRQLTVKI
jgi:hypothetical protein